MANPLMSAVEAIELRRRVAAAEADREVAERERDALLGDLYLARGGELDALFAAIAVRCLGAELDRNIRAALRAAFDAGWDSGRARGEMLLEQANATASERTRERDLAERERDAGARTLVKALAEIERLRALVVEQGTP